VNLNLAGMGLLKGMANHDGLELMNIDGIRTEPQGGRL